MAKANTERPSQVEQKNAVPNETEMKSEQARSTSENKDEERRTNKEPEHKENSQKDRAKDADEDSDDEKHLYQVPTSNEPVATPPPGVLYQVCLLASCHNSCIHPEEILKQPAFFLV